MVRRIPSQVHQRVSRLMRGQLLEPPKWYQAVLDHPPLPLPPKAPPARSAFDTKISSSSKLRLADPKPLDISYSEDSLRRQFFRDHPFEAFRPKTLTERGTISDPNPVSGETWTRLRQRGRNPSSEDAIQFAINLHQYQNVPLSNAYARAVAQFRALRSEHQISTTFAALEAEHFGGTFTFSEIKLGWEKEKNSLRTWERQAELDESMLIARKRWRAIAQDHSESKDWTQGEQYTRLWKEGVRPSYSPALTDPLTDATPHPDYMAALQPRSINSPS
ncbi:mitochondrial ribosomal protein S25-domain-containing protein [Mycena floridula]|nr:mitochondrial ribosomal protein S25-domain-containing protein [Mycena floridula]